MRFLLRASMDTAKANELSRAGKLGSTLSTILKDLKPEAAYFTAEGGQRTAFLFVNFDDPSDIPRFAEPWFFAFDARISIQPAMTAEEVKKGLSKR